MLGTALGRVGRGQLKLAGCHKISRFFMKASLNKFIFIFKGCGSKSVYFQRIASIWRYADLFPHPLLMNKSLICSPTFPFLISDQDTIDALFWTATEPRGKKRDHIGIIPHVLLAVSYVFLHSMLFLLQATTLNVAINASNKGWDL